VRLGSLFSLPLSLSILSLSLSISLLSLSCCSYPVFLSQKQKGNLFVGPEVTDVESRKVKNQDPAASREADHNVTDTGNVRRAQLG